MSIKPHVGDLVIVDLFSQKDNGFARMVLGKYDGMIGVITLAGDEEINEKRKEYPCVMFSDGRSCCFNIHDLILLEKDE